MQSVLQVRLEGLRACQKILKFNDCENKSKAISSAKAIKLVKYTQQRLQ